MKESLDVEYICVPTEHTLAVCLNDSMILHFTRHLLPLEVCKRSLSSSTKMPFVFAADESARGMRHVFNRDVEAAIC